jgi:GTPase SAR1 family protein
MTSNDSIKTYKVAIAGPTNVGKTFFMKKLLGEIKMDEKKSGECNPTLGVEAHPVTFKTNHGLICVNFWDCAGHPSFRGMRDSYYIQSKAGIILGNLNKVNELSSFRNEMKQVIKGSKIICFLVSEMGEEDEVLTGVPHVALNEKEDVMKIVTLSLKLITGFQDIKIIKIMK